MLKSKNPAAFQIFIIIENNVQTMIKPNLSLQNSWKGTSPSQITKPGSSYNNFYDKFQNLETLSWV